MIDVRLLLFAAVAEAAGRTEVTIQLPQGATVADLRQGLVAQIPAVDGNLDGARFAINETFAPETAVLNHGDLAAVIPPVAGG